MRVKGGPDSVVAWDPSHWHGTSLQNFPPTTQVIPEFNQTGLAIFTPNRVAKIWEKHRNKEPTFEDLYSEWAVDKSEEAD